ncbi:hypothetical protein N7492_005306 [Penicillium capsulatum]|uniref:Amino acid permease/ SLC12A domain-containing protein n=1 Tax=Penicillium capsulatum TaxID=69766 RepID=A0A9W9IBQ1_9EURO|nr:hypothetical protein N7492_005306 [Penicillium capsulatum]KAJ6135591.1 hypothetical protein N7512_000751 [Penicillium capsulatum]
MAVGPTLGTGLFIGAGQALAIGGPASLLISYAFLSLLTYIMATTVAEVATYTPTRHGTMVTHGFRYTTVSFGFATACLRWYTMAMFVPFEITTAMVNLGLWSPGGAIAARLGMVTLIVIGFNFLPEKMFKASEVLFTRIKIGTLVFLLVLSLSIGIGGATGHDRWGFQYWKKPGAMHEYLAPGKLGRFWGLMQCLLHSSIAFTMTPELIVHHAEMADAADHPEGPETIDDLRPARSSSIPRRVVTGVATTVFPYILSSLAMGIMAPYNNPLLTNGGAGAGLSPFIIGMNTAKIRILPVTATIAILLSSVASGRTFLYLASRTLCAMADVGHAPAMFKIRTSWGVPFVAVTATATFAIFAFICAATTSSVMFNYFLLFVNSSGFLSWLVSCAVFRQFRQRLRFRGVDHAPSFAVQPFGTYVGFVLSGVLLVANGMSAAAPTPQAGSRGLKILAAYISIPIFLALYLTQRFRDVISSRFPSPANSVKVEPPETSHGKSGLPQGQEGAPSHAIELDQVWSMAREV